MLKSRWVKGWEQDFNRACKMTAVKSALKLICCWVGKPIEEREVVSRYSSRTGKAKKTSFKPCDQWNGIIMLKSPFIGPSINEGDPLLRHLLKVMPAGAVFLFQGLLVEHVPVISDSEGSSHAKLRIVRPRQL